MKLLIFTKDGEINIEKSFIKLKPLTYPKQRINKKLNS